ncbi:hypothetical protein D3C80_1576340 [compost metagenome]
MLPLQFNRTFHIRLRYNQLFRRAHLFIPGHAVERIAVITGVIRGQHIRRILGGFKNRHKSGNPRSHVRSQLFKGLPDSKVFCSTDPGFFND